MYTSTRRSSLHRVATLGACLLLGGACSAGTQTRNNTTNPPESPTPEVGSAEQDRVDEILRLCNRKAGTAVPLCWNDEYQRTHKKFEAQVTLMLQVGPGGSAKEVKAVTSNNASQELQACLINEAKNWSYPSGSSDAYVNCSFFLRSSM